MKQAFVVQVRFHCKTSIGSRARTDERHTCQKNGRDTYDRSVQWQRHGGRRDKLVNVIGGSMVVHSSGGVGNNMVVWCE